LAIPPGTRLGVYEVTSLLGEGGMGQVYRARDTKLDRDVALKILPETFASDPDRLMRFEREAKTLASLNHPNIAAIYGIESNALVMELVEGEDLSTRISRGAIPIDEALPIAKQIAEALEAAHEQGIIHRDLKPANIKVREDGTVKVLDFGLAKAMASDQPKGSSLQETITSPAMTMHGVILGTAAYMSPEQARGKPVDRRADVWAFGVVLYEMLTGRRPFGGDEMSDVLAAVLRQPIDLTVLAPQTPASVRRLLRRCLEKDRGGRLGDMSSARLEIAEALAGDGAMTSVAVAGAPTDQRRWRWVSAALALITVGLASALIGWPAREIERDDSVLRFTLVDDPNMEVHTSTQPFAVSPDGKTIVFSGAAATTGLWARSLDQPAARFLAGSEGGLQPAISPDGQWVAFVVANHIIRKVRLAGGGATTVATIDDVTASIAWASDEEILFEKIGSASGLHRVSANGGAPQLFLPLAGDEIGHNVPVVLREPRLVFYANARPDGRQAAAAPVRGAIDSDGLTLAVFSPADGRRSGLGVDGFRVLGLIDGHLVYARSDGALMAVPFDARDLRVLGQPRLLEPRVSPGRFGPSVTLSENGTLVALPAVSPLSRLMLADAEGRAVPIGEARAFESPRFSPDGSRIAVGIADGDGLDLWTLDRSTMAATRVTRGGPRSVKLESWAPDGLALVHTRSDELWTVPVNGSQDAHKLVDVEGRVLGASVLKGGQSIAVLRRIRVGQGNVDREELVRVPLAGEPKAVPIFTSRSSGSVLRGLDPRASPDGRFVALHDRNDNQVHVRSVEGGAGLQVSDAGGNLPVWGHDSRSLYYRTAAGTVRAELQTSPVLTVVSRRLVPALPAAGTLHDISADGKTFLILVPIDPAPKVLVTVNWAADVRRQLSARELSK
jgi:Tol biopolymer transport system component/predicted Ser/Thr protein kinase